MSRQVARLSTGVAAKVLAELDREVVAMERELGRLSTSVAPSTAYDLCRAFARAFEARLALRGCTILRCFAADQNGLAAAFARLPLGALFSPARVREACLVADGYQPYLVSPENGLRALIREAVEHFRAPSHDCLTRAHGALSAIVDAALSDASAAGRSPACEQALEEELEARRWKRAVSRLDNASTIEARTLPASGRLAGGRRAGDSPRGGIAHLLCVRL